MCLYYVALLVLVFIKELLLWLILWVVYVMLEGLFRWLLLVCLLCVAWWFVGGVCLRVLLVVSVFFLVGCFSIKWALGGFYG